MTAENKQKGAEVYRSAHHRYVAIAGFLIGGLLTISYFGSDWIDILSILFFGGMSVWGFRNLFTGITALPNGIIVRQSVRTRRVEWPEIDRFEVVSYMWLLQPVTIVVLQNGKKIVVGAMQELRPKGQAIRMVAELNELLEKRR